MESDRITLRIGSLAKPLADACLESGRTTSDEIRHRLAESLGVQAPIMLPGDVANLGKYAKPRTRKLRTPRKSAT